MLRALLSVLLSALPCLSATGVTDLTGRTQRPLDPSASVRVLLFVRTDCPITNRYAPELRRISLKYAKDPVVFFLVYPDHGETAANIRNQIDGYGFPGTPLLDSRHELVQQAHAIVAPEAAVFDKAGKLVYHGRIDNRWVDVGKSRPAATVHDLEAAITATLTGKPVAESQTRAVGCSLADLE